MTTKINKAPEKQIKVKEWKYFHAYTDNKDEYFEFADFDNDYNKAKKAGLEQINKWKSEGEINLRLYFVHEKENEDEPIETLVQDLIYTKGTFPY